MASVHVVNVGLVKINAVGNITDGSTNISIETALNLSTDHRILPNSLVSNSQNYPTIASYLQLEAADNYLPVHVDQYTIVTAFSDLSKVDSAPVDGLLGVEDSLGYKVTEIERHLHNNEEWYGRGGGNLAELNNLTTWTITAGNPASTFGTEVQLSNGNQFGGVKYDPHRILITAVSSTNNTYLLELRSGATFAASNIITTVPYRVANPTSNMPMDVIARRCSSTSGLWVRAACQNASATIQLILGIHIYEG